MNSLDQRLRRLEQYQIANDNEEHALHRRSTSKPLPIPGAVPRERINTQNDLELALRRRVEEEKRSHRSQELNKMQALFRDSISTMDGICKKIEYAVEFVEINASKIAQLMNTVSTSDFKRTICISLLEEVMNDEILMNDIIELTVRLKFPKPKIVARFDVLPTEEPEPVKPKKSGWIKKK